MNTELKIASSKVHDINKAKKFEDRDKEEQKVIRNYTVWENLLNFIEKFGENSEIESGLVIIKTNDGDIRTNAYNMDSNEYISVLEESKQRFYFNKFMEDII